MADTIDEVTKENVVVGEVNDLYESENQNVEQSSSVEIGILKVPDSEGFPGSGAVLEISQGSPEGIQAAEQIQEGRYADGDSEKYKEIEGKYEQQQPEEDSEVVIKEQVVRITKSADLENKEEENEEIGETIVNEEFEEEELNEHGQQRIVSKNEEVKVLQHNFVNDKNFIEVEEEYEEEEVDETGEMRTIKKTRLVKVEVEKSDSFEEIEEEYDEEETDENNEIVIVRKKRIVMIPKQTIESPKESIHDVESKEKSEAEESVDEEENEEVKEDELDEEETSKGEVKKEQEEEDEKDTLSVGEKKSVASLSSSEVLLAQEKLAMAQQYEILTKLRSEHSALKRKHLFLNNKLVQYFRKQKMDHVFAETKEDPALEQQYLKKLMIFYETNQQMTEEKLKINTEWEAQRNINEELVERVKRGWKELFSHKREIAAKLIDPKTGRTVPCDKGIEDLLNRQEIQLKLISECRLAQIKLKRRIEGKRTERQMQHAGKEFNLMDYEKLTSLKEYYMDKITERDIEIEEVSQKLTAMDDTLTHVREQLQKKEDEFEQEQERLQRMTLELNNKRANLNILKATRHKTEKNTAKIKQQSGLLAYPVLLKDYEEKTQLLQLLMSQTEALKQTHRAAVVRIRKLREIVKKRTHEKVPHDMLPSTITFSDSHNLF